MGQLKVIKNVVRVREDIKKVARVWTCPVRPVLAWTRFDPGLITPISFGISGNKGKAGLTKEIFCMGLEKDILVEESGNI